MPLNPVHLISHKRDGGELDPGDIAAFIGGFSCGDVPDYQMSAFAMAVYFQGMTDQETVALTQAMLASGISLDWTAGPPLVDKHSTGGVGDKVSLVLAPLLAACDLRVPMISGRGLGPTGGTLDKLEAIPGFRAVLDVPEITAIVNSVGCVIAGASDRLAPADRRLYALRDVTGTVPSIPLITASILSKKLAESLDVLVLDVKCGSGAFMKTEQQARMLAESLVTAGTRLGVETIALITDMNQPLGRTCGNAIEVDEALECLAGHGPEDLREITLALGAEALLAAGRSSSLAAARETLAARLDDGSARERFATMVHAQGGSLAEPRRRPKECFHLLATETGYVSAINTDALGRLVIDLGGGRKKLNDSINHAVGIDVLVRIGEPVTARETPLVRLFAEELQFDDGNLLRAFTIVPGECAPRSLMIDRVTAATVTGAAVTAATVTEQREE